jgi:hypothetical protein
MHLKDHKLVVRVGHPPGEDCKSQVVDTVDMTVIHVNGIHFIKVQFCTCPDAPSQGAQLMRSSLWPSTPMRPKTAATFNVLHLFHTLNHILHCTAYSFYQSLVHLTDPWRLDAIPVSPFASGLRLR